MKAIVSVLQPPKGILPLFRLMVSPPVRCKKSSIGTQAISVYTLNPLWKSRFRRIISALRKKHASLLFDESMKKYPRLYWEPPKAPLFYENFATILSCHCGTNLIRPVIVSQEPDERLLPLLKAFSRHAKAVALCTKDSPWFESVSQEALKCWGLSLTKREPDVVNQAELTVILSLGELTLTPKNPVIDLSGNETFSWENCLLDYSAPEVKALLLQFPQLRLKHCYLVPKNGQIQNLIWKIRKKS